ncbi:hypothetical protein BH10ACI1_BH10ACI1_25450 [soil metagenome]
MRKLYFPIISILLTSCFFANFAEAQRKKPKVKVAESYKIAREGIGIEGITVGTSSRSDVIEKLGKNYVRKTYGKYSYSINYAGLGLAFYYCQTDRRQEIFDIEIRAPYKAKTGKGIILGQSTLEDIYKIYGRSTNGLKYTGVNFFYAKSRGKNIVTVIDIVENAGIRQCTEAK